MTKAVRQYLQDWRDRHVEEAIARWESGELMGVKEEGEVAAVVRSAIEIKNLEYEHIARFYGLEENAEINETDSD